MENDIAIYLRLANRLCIVVGAGSVGQRRALALLKAGARTRVIAPHGGEFPPEVELLRREFNDDDFTNAFMVVAATNSPIMNERIASLARAAGALVNVADSPENSDFIVPAQGSIDGEISFAVTTHGNSAALASKIKNNIHKSIEPEWAVISRILGELRPRCLAIALSNNLDSKKRAELWRRVVDLPLLELAKEGRGEEIKTVVIKLFSGSK